ncbi:MAG: transglutaminase family protein [Proteobacteria bacterium]|uniref:transglutaminase family protein n=1 Tax=Aquabacterium sp. TaxID=1872578 RepID=UPI0035C75798|nr:transglutaminase family protein [Pseudomonadota bacterium]
MTERLNAPSARLHVEHETLYHYDHPVEQAQHIACLRPLSDAGQRLLSFEMAVQPTPQQHSTRRDSHGNSRAYFALHSAHQALRVLARSEVLVTSRYEGLREGLEAAAIHRAAAVRPYPLGPSCGDVRERLRYRAHAPFEPAAEHLYASPFVPLHAELRAYGAASLHDDRPLAEAAIELMQRIHADFAYAPASTDISTPILTVLRERRGVCQDFAHLMLGCLRACGLAGRYVSGYLLTRPPPGQAPLVGADASHAWVSVWVPGLGLPLADDWLDLDPTNDVVPGVHHVRVAHGRDFGDVTPLRGVIRGGGAHRLEVKVTTRRV